MCAHSPEGQPYPGLHREKHGQQFKGADSAPLLCCGKTPPGVLHSSLEPSAQKRPVGAGPEEGLKTDQRAGTPLIGGKADRVGVVQPGEEKALRRHYSSLSVSEGGLQESWRGAFYKDM